MLSIEEASKQISRSLQDRYIELKLELTSVNEMIATTAKEFKEAAAKGDHSENAAFTEAKDKLTKLNTQKVYLLQDIEFIESAAIEYKYVPKTYIDVYSTFRLKREDTNEISTWKVYPGSVYDIDRGIMSYECQMFSLLKGKESGEVVTTKNRISGKTVKFLIQEVY